MLQLLLSSCLYISVFPTLYFCSLNKIYQEKGLGPPCFITSEQSSSAAQSQRRDKRTLLSLSNVTTPAIIMSLHFCSRSLRRHYLLFQEKYQGKTSPYEQLWKGLFNFPRQKSVYLKTLPTIQTFVLQRNNGNSLVTDICIALVLVFVFLVLVLAVLRVHGHDDGTSGEENSRETEVNGFKSILYI